MTQHESGGLTSQHDVEIFRAWKRTFPAYNWSRAEVDRNGGLTLFETSFGIESSLHFRHAICGFEGGVGPGATITILEEAGYGDTEKLSPLILGNQKVSLTKE